MRLLLAFIPISLLLAGCQNRISVLSPKPGNSPAPLGGDRAGEDDESNPSQPFRSLKDEVVRMSKASQCAQYHWKERGSAPEGYVAGVSLVFARSLCAPARSDVVAVSRAVREGDRGDALAWYAPQFSELKQDGARAGADVLRQTYLLLMGLGMRESSGQHCCGRDGSANNVSADSAEAGTWQTSYDSRGASPELPKLFERYQTSKEGCFLDVFQEGVSCDAGDKRNYGSGPGNTFQQLSKECPGFAAEYAAILVRVQGGEKGHYGPLRRHEAELNSDCDALLKGVQELVDKNRNSCNGL